MTMVNQRGEPVLEDYLYDFSSVSHDELQTIVFAILDHLKLEALRTNATKHGNTELIVRPTGETS